MKIAIRNEKGGVWKRIPPNGDGDTANGDGDTDEYIQDLIHQIPELISVEGAGQNEPNLKVCIKSTQGNGSQDDSGLIGIDGDGNIAIVECKVANGSSARGQIMGQALEYAASLWEISYEEFDSMVLNCEGRSIAELMSEKIPAEEWSEEKFKGSISAALQKGDFRLIMVVDGITDELKRTIKFLNARSPSSFETYAVEILHFSDGQTDVVVPKIMSFSELENTVSAKEASPSQSPSQVPVSQPSNPQASNSANPTIAPAEQPVQVSDPDEPSFADSEQSTNVPDPPEPTATQQKSSSEGNEQKETLFFAKCADNVNKETLEIIRKLHAFSAGAADDIMWSVSGALSPRIRW